MYMLIFANIGGAITPIGDPPNVIIASNVDVIQSVSVGNFFFS
jgi:Na+/H+ antiporter NhaD/arsenite permease-like protein